LLVVDLQHRQDDQAGAQRGLEPSVERGGRGNARESFHHFDARIAQTANDLLVFVHRRWCGPDDPESGGGHQ
jgi:hypothetical protein